MISSILNTRNSAPYGELLSSSCGGLKVILPDSQKTFEKPLKIKGFAYRNIVIPLKVKGPTAKIFENPLKVKGEITKTFEMPLTN